METFVFDIRNEIKEHYESYYVMIEEKLKGHFKSNLIRLIIEEYKQNTILENCDLDVFIKDEIRKYINKKDEEIIYKYINDKINEIIEKYINYLKEKYIPPYLIFISSLYLKNELENKYYFEIDKVIFETSNLYEGKEKEDFINLWVFKSILITLYNNGYKIFNDDFTKNYSIYTIDLIGINFNLYINQKQSIYCINETIKNIFNYNSLFDFYNKIYNRILDYRIISEYKNNFDEEKKINPIIKSLLDYHNKTSSFNCISNLLSVFNENLFKCILFDNKIIE